MPRPGTKKDGFVKKEPKEFDEQVVEIDRVTRVVKGGRKMRFRATVVVGNRKGKVGIGIGKSNEVTGAIQKAVSKAKKHMLNITLDGSTIPHVVAVKYKAARVLLMPAVEGTGLIAGSSIRKVLELVGIKDIMSKCFGSSNKVNNTKAAFEALSKLKTNPFMARKAQFLQNKRAEAMKTAAAANAKAAEAKKTAPAPKAEAKPAAKPEIKPAAEPTK